MTDRVIKLIFIGAMAILQEQTLPAQKELAGRFSQQEVNWMARSTACQNGSAGISNIPDRPNATAGVVSDDFTLAAKPILDAIMELRQYPRSDEHFYDLADEINTSLTPLLNAIEYVPDSFVCDFLSTLYGWVVEIKAKKYRDVSVREAEVQRVDICSPLLRKILDTKNLLGSNPRFVYAPCSDATKKITMALKASQTRREKPKSP